VRALTVLCSQILAAPDSECVQKPSKTSTSVQSKGYNFESVKGLTQMVAAIMRVFLFHGAAMLPPHAPPLTCSSDRNHRLSLTTPLRIRRSSSTNPCKDPSIQPDENAKLSPKVARSL
jgi:hypothetical protein